MGHHSLLCCECQCRLCDRATRAACKRCIGILCIHQSPDMAGSAALAMSQCRPLPPALRPGRPCLARARRPVRLPLAPRSQQDRQEGPSGATLTEAAPRAPAGPTVLSRKQEGASTDLSVILPRLKKVRGSCVLREGTGRPAPDRTGWDIAAASRCRHAPPHVCPCRVPLSFWMLSCVQYIAAVVVQPWQRPAMPPARCGVVPACHTAHDGAHECTHKPCHPGTPRRTAAACCSWRCPNVRQLDLSHAWHLMGVPQHAT